jgi:hypothetical protein
MAGGDYGRGQEVRQPVTDRDAAGADMPQKFKTPGTQAPLVGGDNNKLLIIGAAERDELVQLRQEALQEMARERNLAPNGTRFECGG